ncbi:hypothetical protein APLC1_0845 [Limnospira platensis C1]|nr:hypothetical protein APLC1_0845 [Arthrospira platensis C1]
MRTEVESRLTQSIHRAAIVNLGKEQQPQQVQRPWDMSVKVGEQRSVKLPPRRRFWMCLIIPPFPASS